MIMELMGSANDICFFFDGVCAYREQVNPNDLESRADSASSVLT